MQECWLFRGGAFDAFDDEKHGRRVVVRRAGATTLQLVVQPTLDGQDKVSALLLSGRLVWEKKYPEKEHILLQDIRAEIHVSLIQRKLATSQTYMYFTMNNKPLTRGNCVVKPRIKKIGRQVAHQTHAEFEARVLTRPISRYFPKKTISK
jgi:hypothetical protein